MYNSSHTSDLSSSMACSSVSSATLADIDDCLTSDDFESNEILNLFSKNTTVSISSVLTRVSSQLIKDLYESGQYKRVIEVASELL